MINSPLAKRSRTRSALGFGTGSVMCAGFLVRGQGLPARHVPGHTVQHFPEDLAFMRAENGRQMHFGLREGRHDVIMCALPLRRDEQDLAPSVGVILAS